MTSFLLPLGQLTFVGKTVATQMTLADDLTVATLNGRQVEVMARDLVLWDQDATIKGPHTLHLAGNSTGNGFIFSFLHLSLTGFT